MANNDKQSGERPSVSGRPDPDSDKNQRTPASDMQAEDTGTAASGADASRTPAESVMKQEHKTSSEGGAGRR